MIFYCLYMTYYLLNLPMKKTCLLFFVFITGTANLFAQGAKNNASKCFDNLKPAGMTAAKTTTATGERLIALVAHSHNGNSFYINDSSTYSYSGTRGRAYSNVQPGYSAVYYKFDESHYYVYDTLTGLYTNNIKYSQTFNSSDNITTKLTQNWAGTWENNMITRLFYDTNNNVILDRTESWNTGTAAWDSLDKTFYTYDASNNVVTRTYEYWDGVSWVNASSNLYTYNSSNQLTSNTYELWNSWSGIWDSTDKYVYRYDAMLNLEFILSGNFATGSWIATSRDSNVYDGMNNQIATYGQSWNATTGAWDNTARTLYSGFVAHQPQIVSNANIDTASASFINTYQILNAYDTANMITDQSSKEWRSATSAWESTFGDFAGHWYYEAYATGVTNVTSNADVAIITYPNPSGGQFSVQTATLSKSYSIVVCDILGKIIANLPLKSAGVTSVDLGNITSGLYTYKIVSATGELSGRGKLIVQK